MITLRILRWEDLSGRAQCNHKGLYKREEGGLRVIDDRSRGWTGISAGGPLVKNTGSLSMLGKARNGFSLEEL